MMYESLYQYFLQYKQLSVPGIGTFFLDRTPATVNFPDKRMDPPVYAVRLDASGLTPSRSFFSWLGAALQVSERDAVIRFNDFAFDLKKSILSGARTCGRNKVFTCRPVSTGSAGRGGETDPGKGGPYGPGRRGGAYLRGDDGLLK